MKRPMQRLTLAIGALVVAVPMAVAQGNGNGNGKGNARNAAPVAGHCPPGLAKKNPPCVPPGQARNVQPERDVYRDHDRIIYSRGDYIPDGYVVVRDPGAYGLDPYNDYYRVGDNFYRVDSETRKVINFVGAFADLMN